MAQALEFVTAGYLRHGIEQSGFEGTTPQCDTAAHGAGCNASHKIGILLIDDDKRGRGGHERCGRPNHLELASRQPK